MSESTNNETTTKQPIRIRSRFPKAQPNIGPSSGINRIRRLSGHFNNNDNSATQTPVIDEEENRNKIEVLEPPPPLPPPPPPPIVVVEVDKKKKEEELVSTATDSTTLILIDDISTTTTTTTQNEDHHNQSIQLNNYNPRFSKEHIMNIIKFKALQKLKKIESDSLKEKRRSYKPVVTIETELPIDRSRLRMRDLLYYNPKNRLKTKSIDGSIDENSNRSTIFDDRSSTPPPPPPPPTQPPQPTNTSYNAPQLKFAEDGSIVLNEESLVIQRPNIEPVFDSTVIENDRNDNLTYNSYRKFHHTKKWSSKETVKFYRALSMIGTDFTMIQRLFPYRNRDEIKRKFKREEKINQALIDKILSKTAPMDLSVFVSGADDDDDEESEKEEEEEKKNYSNENENNKKNKKKPYNRYKPKRTKKRAFVEQSSSDDEQIVKKVNKNVNETINTVVVTSLEEEKEVIVETEEIPPPPPLPPITTRTTTPTNDNDDDIELVIDLDNDCCEIIETPTTTVNETIETNNEEDIVILDLDSNQTIIKQTNPSSSSYLHNTNSKLIFVNQPSTSSFQVHVVTPQPPSKTSNSEIVITQLKK